jgi:hyperosmotically inducible periplasmic protein
MLASTRWKLRAFFLFVLACSAAVFTKLPPASASQTGKAEPKQEENSLAHEVRHQLQVVPYYSVFDYIAFTLDGHKVTLTGSVLRPHLRNDAERAIASIEGVTSVENFIQVLPKSSTDDDLRRSVYRAIFEDSVLQRYAVSEVPSIHILVKEGSITLEGSVENENNKNLAASRASGVSGVASVNNHLSIRTKGAPAN